MEQTIDEQAAPRVLVSRWDELRAEQPQLRIRQAAALLGVSELSLLLCRPPEALVPLRPEFGELLSAMESVGDVMILARNEEVVHEVTGTFHNFRVSSSGAMGLAVGTIDVRVFFRQWQYGFRVREEVRSGMRESFQFFDAWGTAIQKIYRVAGTDGAAWDSLVDRFSDRQRRHGFRDQGPRPAIGRADPASVDIESLRQGWASLKDVHHFNALLQSHRVDRLTALELIGPLWARKLEPRAEQPETGVNSSPLDHLLEQVRANQCPIMVFVGNPGIVQIHTGRVDRLRRTGDWMNILDSGFNLHARTTEITDWWVVRRPSVDGTITSLEGFNRSGDLVITVFGQRKPGQAEDAGWQDEVKRLEARICA